MILQINQGGRVTLLTGKEMLLDRFGAQLQHQTLNAVGAQPHFEVIGRHDDFLHQQHHDPGLLGREQLIPNRVEPGHGHGDLRLVQSRIELDRLRQHLTQEIRGTQDRAQLVEHGRLEFGGRQSRQARGSRVLLGIPLWHVVTVAPAILFGGVPW